MYNKKMTKWTILLNRYRFMHGISMNEMAKKIGLTFANYHAIENCQRARPKMETFKSISLEMNIPMEELQKVYYESYISKN